MKGRASLSLFLPLRRFLSAMDQLSLSLSLTLFLRRPDGGRAPLLLSLSFTFPLSCSLSPRSPNPLFLPLRWTFSAKGPFFDGVQATPPSSLSSSSLAIFGGGPGQAGFLSLSRYLAWVVAGLHRLRICRRSRRFSAFLSYFIVCLLCYHYETCKRKR